MSAQKLTLKGGTCVHVDGIPVFLSGDTEIEIHSTGDVLEQVRAHSTVPFQEYPKMLPGGRVVASADEEAQWASPPVPDPVAQTEPVSPLDDVVIEMDNPAFQPPPKAAKKK